MPLITVVALLLVAKVATGSVQSDSALSTLTVPATALPDGCLLEPAVELAESRAQGATLRLWPGTAVVFPTNPWTGSDAGLVTAVRHAIDPVLAAKPDGQVVTSSSGSSSATRNDDVREAYRAVYTAAGGSRTYVAGIRFNDVDSVGPEPVAALTNPPRAFERRFVRGATVVRVSSTASDACTRAIVAHVQSVM